MKMTEKGVDISDEIGTLRENIHEKPCIVLGYCPYGPLVEDFPLPNISRSEAKEHNEYLKSAIATGKFERGDHYNLPFMSREDAEKEVAEFNENDYPIEDEQDEWCVCGVFGHFCPVLFVSEPFIDDESGKESEIMNCCDTCAFELYEGNPEECPLVTHDELPSIVFTEIAPYLKTIRSLIGCREWIYNGK